MLENPALDSLPSASSRLSPTTFGTMDPPGVTKIVTVLPTLAFEFGGGSCLTTVLGGALELFAVCVVTRNPAPFKMASASVSDLCLTSGTFTSFGPVDTKIVTVLPAFTTFPLGGLVLITMLLGIVALGCFTTVNFSPALVIACSATVSVWPSTCGTAWLDAPPPKTA